MTSQEKPLLHIVGDSISMQYGPYLAQMLAGVLTYSRKPAQSDEPDSANGGDSAMVLDYLRQRLAQPPKIDLLMVNCGLHDIKMNPGQSDHQAPVAQYEQNLQAILGLARERDLPMIWVRTTPVVDAIHNSRSTRFKRYGRDVEQYNAAADRVMAAHNIATIDLFTFTRNLGPDVYVDHVHYTAAVRAQHAAFIAGRLYEIARAL